MLSSNFSTVISTIFRNNRKKNVPNEKPPKTEGSTLPKCALEGSDANTQSQNCNIYLKGKKYLKWSVM